MSRSESEKEAREILYRPLGNSLDPNWWADTQRLIVEALDRAKAEQREADARIAENYSYGLADEYIPDDKIDAYNKGCEDSKIDISSAIRSTAKEEK